MGRVKRLVCLAALSLTAAGSAGCQIGDAFIDGAYGGISDTVAGAISGVLLQVMGI